MKKTKRLIILLIIFFSLFFLGTTNVQADSQARKSEIGEAISREIDEDDNSNTTVSAFSENDANDKSDIDVSAASSITISKNGYAELSVTGTFNYGWANDVLTIVNQERAKQGLNSLQMDKDLSDAAMQRAAELAIKFSHTRPNGTSCFTASQKAWGENIAAGQWSPSVAMTSWMNSDGHRANILGASFKTIGIGCCKVGGVYYWVQMFGTQYKAGATLTGAPTFPTIVEVELQNFKVWANNSSDLELEIGKEANLKSTVEYSGTSFDIANNSSITYTSSDNSIATISNGKVKAVKLGTVTITAKVGSSTATCKVTVVPKVFSVYYRTHVQNIGWQDYVRNGKMAGTQGKSLRLEGINIYLDNLPVSGGIEYSTHVQNIGWQGFVKDGAMSGTSGKSYRLEAIKIRLTGEVSKQYDIYYRVHCQNIGWMGWAKNGESSGSAGFGYRLEGIEIKLVKKGGNAPGTTANKFKQNIMYQTHVENVGWQNFVNLGEMSGTSGRSLRLEGIKIMVPNSDVSGNIEYCTHVQNIGWQNFVKNGEMSGTSGRSYRLEAIKIRLTGNLANTYDVYYRVHCQNIGWMGWAKNGESAGSAGFGYRLEGIEIVLVDKGATAPGSTTNSFVEKISKQYVINKNSKIFHIVTCQAVKKMNDSNKQFVVANNQDLISQGYSACKDCKP